MVIKPLYLFYFEDWKSELRKLFYTSKQPVLICFPLSIIEIDKVKDASFQVKSPDYQLFCMQLSGNQENFHDYSHIETILDICIWSMGIDIDSKHVLEDSTVWKVSHTHSTKWFFSLFFRNRRLLFMCVTRFFYDINWMLMVVII